MSGGSGGGCRIEMKAARGWIQEEGGEEEKVKEEG